MKQIWKYPIGLSITHWDIPAGGKILSAQMQGNTLCLWAIVDPEAPRQRRAFVVYGTGHDMLPEENPKYISTVQIGPLVWHVFEVRPENNT